MPILREKLWVFYCRDGRHATTAGHGKKDMKEEQAKLPAQYRKCCAIVPGKVTYRGRLR